MSKEKQTEEKYELSTSIYMSGYGLLRKDCDDIAEQLYNAGYHKQVEGEWIAKDNFNGRCTIATCSSCGVEKAFSVLVRIETISTLYPYCQKCGAHMRKEDEKNG